MTYFFYPILWALSIAYKSIYGFQSESNRITVSADVKLIPRPPALVDNKNINFLESLLLNSSIY